MSTHFRSRRGLDIPLTGAPEQTVFDVPPVKSVALVGQDFLGLRPSLEVQVGDRVRLGQCLFTHKKLPGVPFVAPGSGEVTAINRGQRRVLQSVVIRLDGEDEPAVVFPSLHSHSLAALDRGTVVDRLLKSGLWTSFRTRPFSKIPVADAEPAAIFVTAIDSNPLAADPRIVIAEQGDSFRAGVELLTTLTTGKVYVCQSAGESLPKPDTVQAVIAEFAGPHPSGLAGTHIHFLEPVSLERSVWTVGYQDVIAIGKLFTEGVLWTERVIAFGGPMIDNPRLLRTRAGANLDDLIGAELPPVESRVISGSVLSGRRAASWAAYLGRYHNQVSVLAEGRERELFGWIRPGRQKFSATRVFVSRLFPGRRFALNTSTNGSPRAMVPIGIYESMMPQDLLPTQLLRSLLVQDTTVAQTLGCLELDEEDLALMSFVCPGKYDYGPALRANLDIIEKEG
ncbi:MAG: Na(+)-translocating NADH-quinone reductase subunit A [Chromatiales bacterium]|nr:MAG: Na(+)-translocating NADH-quinone reductase subunit A [Chromatiales bacterium]